MHKITYANKICIGVCRLENNLCDWDNNLCQQDQYHVQDKHVKTRLWENWIMTCAYEMANCVKQDSKNRVEIFMEFLNMTILLTKAIILRDVEINNLAPSRRPKADLTSTEITNLSHSAPP